MKLVKCPRCELNYITENEKYCKVCLREMKGEAPKDEVELCSVCNEAPALPGRDPDQPVRAHLPDDPPRAVRELAGPRHAGRNGEDRAQPRLWPVQEPLSL